MNIEISYLYYINSPKLILILNFFQPSPTPAPNYPPLFPPPSRKALGIEFSALKDESLNKIMYSYLVRYMKISIIDFNINTKS